MLIDIEDVEYMDDMELEEFLQDNFNDVEAEVFDELGLYLEPNGYGETGEFIIYDNDTYDELANIDFQEFQDMELNIASECDTIEQYREKFKDIMNNIKGKQLNEDMKNIDIGEYAQWYRISEPGEIDDDSGEDVQEVLNSYGLKYLGWAVAKDEYFDTFMDNGLEYCIIAQDTDTHNIGIYQWVGDRLYDPKDEIEMMNIEDEDIYESISMHEALQEAFDMEEVRSNNEL